MAKHHEEHRTAGGSGWTNLAVRLQWKKRDVRQGNWRLLGNLWKLFSSSLSSKILHFRTVKTILVARTVTSALKDSMDIQAPAACLVHVLKPTRTLRAVVMLKEIKFRAFAKKVTRARCAKAVRRDSLAIPKFKMDDVNLAIAISKVS